MSNLNTLLKFHFIISTKLPRHTHSIFLIFFSFLFLYEKIFSFTSLFKNSTEFRLPTVFFSLISFIYFKVSTFFFVFICLTRRAWNELGILFVSCDEMFGLIFLSQFFHQSRWNWACYFFVSHHTEFPVQHKTMFFSFVLTLSTPDFFRLSWRFSDFVKLVLFCDIFWLCQHLMLTKHNSCTLSQSFWLLI